MTEQEEFEFRARLEAEQVAPKTNALQRRMGFGRPVSGQAENKLADALLNLPDEMGGAVTDIASKVLPPEGAALAGTAARLAPDIATTVGTAGVGAAMKAPGVAKTLMQSSMKPIRSQIETGKFDRAVNTMLEKGISATQSGLKKMSDAITGLEEKVAEIVKNSKGTLKRDDVLETLLPVYEKFLTQTSHADEVASISKVAKDVIKHPAVGDDITVQAAQAMKEANYRDLGDKAYGMGLKPAAERDAKKAVTRGLREGIEKAEPGVAPLNKEASELINATKILARRTGMEANKNPAGLGWAIHGGPSSPWYWLWLAERSPAVKSAIAQGLYSGKSGRNLGALTGSGTAYGMGGELSDPGNLEDLLRRQQQ